jgi:hypothetical protein
MIERGLGFQVFFTSRESCKCPLLPDILRIGEKIKNTGVLEKPIGVVSVAFGKRVIINGCNTVLDRLEKDDVVEIIDCDPVKKIILVMGVKNPNVEASIHWMIHHAREDVHAIIQLNEIKKLDQLSEKLPSTEKEYPSGTLELAIEILKTLKTDKRMVIKNKGLLCVGSQLKEVENLVVNTLKGLK